MSKHPPSPTPLPSAQRACARRLSCGTVILNPAGELLLCHVTGQRHWDLPKGGIESGETPVHAALRETREETGLRLDPAELIDLGRLAYTDRKDLHLFAALLPRIDTAALHCESRFSDFRTGTSRPEMDDFGWFAADRVASLCTGTMGLLLTRTIDLGQTLARLTARADAAAPRVRHVLA